MNLMLKGRCIALAILVLAGCAPTGLAGKAYTAYRMAVPPVLDGHATEACWQTIPWAYGFHNLFDPSHVFSRKQTAFKIGYDNQNLYLAVRCMEPDMEQLKTGHAVIDGWPDQLDDIYFIYAGTYDDRGTWEDSPYTIMQIGAGDIQRAHVRGERDPAIPPGWKTAYRADDRNWWLETAIPLGFLGIDPHKGGWFNIVRHLWTVDGNWKTRTSTWTTTVNAKLSQHSLSRLVLSSKPGVNDPAAVELSKELGGTDYGYRLGLKLRDIQNKGGEFAEARINKFHSPNWPDIEKAREKIETIMERSPNYRTEFRAKIDAYLDFLFALSQARETSGPIQLTLETRDAVARVHVGDREVELRDGAYSLFLNTGANVLALTATAAGANPGVRVMVPSYPEVNTRWRTAVAATGAWRTVKFDDRAWAVPSARDGFMWAAKGDAKACFRQVLLWSKAFYGGQFPVLSPPHSPYGFSPDTVECLHHVIFLEPTGTPMDKYVLDMEIPKGFILNIKPGASSGASEHWASQNFVPATNSVQEIDIDGQPYQRHTLTYEAKKAPGTSGGKPVTAITSVLPVKHAGYNKARAVFRFRRLINDNVTGLTSPLQVHMLPPVNGRNMGTIRYSQYDHALVDPRLGSFPDTVLEDLVKQGVAAGIDTWFVNSRGPQSEMAKGMIQDNGGRMVFWVPVAQPQWGAWSGSVLQKLIQSDARYAARGFNDSGPRFGKDNPAPYYSEFCFSYALGEGRGKFGEALLEDYRRWKATLPASVDTFFFNDENYPWGHTGNQTEHAYCFCDRCKQAFKTFANLPADLVLDDQMIYDTYYKAWETFWKHNQKGRLVKLAREALNQAGLNMLFYHNTHDKEAWKAVTELGKPDKSIVGFPGGGVFVDRSAQIDLDNTRDWLRSLGMKSFQGQTRTYFMFHPGIVAPNCKDGFTLDPKTTKTQLLRMAAVTHGGMVFEGVEQLTGGCLYYLGEATRLIAAYEALFHHGERRDKLADAVLPDSKVCTYPDILVLAGEAERLVLVFNESPAAKTLTLNNHAMKPGMRAEIFERPGRITDPATFDIVVPAHDVLAVHIRPE